MHYTKPSASRLLELMEQHIVILDGAMGTMIQQHNLTEEDFRLWFPHSFLIAIFSFPAETEEFSPFIIPKHLEP